MHFPIVEIDPAEFPPLIREIADPPQKLTVRGNLPPSGHTCLAVVGSRNYTDYGKQAVETIIGGLHGAPIAIISGLALGIDALAHRAALDAGLYTLAIPGSGIDDSVIYPVRHKPLARDILESGGGLLSEFEPMFEATTWSFPQRNRIMAGMSHAVLVIEASARSGTLITSRLATDYNRDVLAVPGSIFSRNAEGPHMLIRLGATPVTSAADVLDALNIAPSETSHASPIGVLSPEEARILALLNEPTERDRVIRELEMDVSYANVLLMQMEIKGLIHDRNGNLFKV